VVQALELLEKGPRGYKHAFLQRAPMLQRSKCRICDEGRDQHASDQNEMSYEEPTIRRPSIMLTRKVSAPGPSLRECDICCEEFEEEQFFSLGCGHQFCKECLADHLEANIADGKV